RYAIERQRLIAALQTSEFRFRNIIEMSVDGILVVDMNGIVRFVNPAAAAFFGSEAGQLLGESFGFPLVDGEIAELEIASGAGKLTPAETRMVKTEWEGESAYLVSIRDITKRKQAERKLRKYQDNLEDLVEKRAKALTKTNEKLHWEITERKQTETALQAAEASFRNIVARSAEGLIIVDRAGIVRFANPMAESIFGRPADELLGELFSSIIMEDEAAELDIMEFYIIRPDGTPGIGEMRMVETEWEGESADLVSVRDITDRKRAEKEITTKNRDLETLLYVISHDLREPLRAIENFSRMVNNRYARQLDEKGQDFLRRVVRGADRLHCLLDDIFTLSRAQRMEPPTETIAGEVVVHEVLERLGTMINQTGATIRIERNLPRLRVDKTWATEAVYNVIANALKFTGEGVAPEIEIAPYRPRGRDPREVGIVIRDRGPGVAPEHAERIFQLFQRAVGREVDGTGAGLAIVRQIAERHGGHAWVQPRKGGGSAFIITFGRSETPGAPHGSQSENERSLMA
ncbi:MAG: PAS domain S-box protein, partial [Candidatus Poribacteria bacterium]|nr:PAS domain S-box protein [Candidatus Poribacteria bacterium]